MKNKRKITLGFTDQEFEEGAHICQIFNEETERHEVLIDYVFSGLKDGENTICCSDNETKVSLSEFLSKNGFSYEEVSKSGDFSFSKTRELYFENDEFVPERMLSLLKESYQISQKQNRAGARVIGEMPSEIKDIKGGSRLLEYECMVSILVREYPITSVCQYDARDFDGSSIMDILKVHPYMIVNGSVVSNPLFVKPEDFLSNKYV